jgi:hypothetical protein
VLQTRTQGHIYVAMMVPDGGGEFGAIRVSRYTYKPGATNAAMLATQVKLLQWKHVTYIHKGGWLGFLPTASANKTATSHVSNGIMTSSILTRAFDLLCCLIRSI